jgi:tRNA A37 methylthiotransferase MiaB
MKYQFGLLKMIKKDRLVGILCPIQSGSSRILKMMNRYIDIDNLVNSLLEFKKNNHKFVISTHIMVGFPSETDDDFFNTLKILKKVRFYNTTIHAYNDINGTEAFNLANKINNKVIQRRMNIAMRELLREGMLYDCDDL